METQGPGVELCTSCGLCCMGAIHDAAVLDHEEVEGARGLGLAIRTRGRPGFALPCPLLQESACSKYETRPRVCSRYKCKLLQRLELGEATLETALRHVHQAKDLLSHAQSAMPDGVSLAEARSAATSAAIDRSAPPDQQQSAELLLRTTAFNLYLDKHFRNSRDKRMFKLTSLIPARNGTDPE